MFDIGFFEICLVGLVSLLVIGPEKLPKAARLAGFWVGKTRSMVASVKAEIKEELQAEEMRQMLKEQTEVVEVKQLLQEGSDLVNNISSTVKSIEKKESLKKTDESK